MLLADPTIKEAAQRAVIAPAAHQTGECLTIVMYYGQVAGEMAAK